MTSIHLSQSKSGYAWLSYLIPAVLLIAGLTVWTDYLQASRENARFYLSESVLFSFFWCLFPPLLFLQHSSLKATRAGGFFRTGLSIALPLIFHILLYASIINLLGEIFLGHGFQWVSTLTYAFTEFYHVLIIGYTLPVVFAIRSPVSMLKPKIQTEAEAMELKTALPAFALTDPQEKSSAYLKQLVIRVGRNSIFIPLEEVHFLQSSSPYLKVQLAKRYYLHMETLSSMALKLDPSAFVQVHKSTIVRRDAVREMKSRANGDYDLFLENGHQVRLSRRYLATFKGSGKHRPGDGE